MGKRRSILVVAFTAALGFVLFFGVRSGLQSAQAHESRLQAALASELAAIVRQGAVALRAIVVDSRRLASFVPPFTTSLEPVPVRARYGATFEQAHRLELALGDDDATLSWYLKVLLETEDPDEEVATLCRIARVQMRRGGHDQAVVLVERALAVAGAGRLELARAESARAFYAGESPTPPSGAEGTAFASVSLAAGWARASPDAQQVVRVDGERCGWPIEGEGRTWLVVAFYEDVLAATISGYRDGRWRLSDGIGARSLPAPFPDGALRASDAASSSIERDVREYRHRQLAPPVLAALLLAVGGALSWVELRRRERFEERKHAFVCSVTHELKTPIANISLFAETLRDHGQHDPDQVPRFAGIILKESKRLERRVQEVLDVASGRTQLPSSNGVVDVGGVAFDLVDELRARADPGSERIELRRDAGSTGDLRARGSAALLRRALEGVLENAIKYAPDGAIVVGLEREGSSVVLSVEDAGPGIPAGEHARVFEPFVRLGDEMTRNPAGTGLGLALVRQAVEDCGGTIDVEASAAGGARFAMRLRAQDDG